MTRCTKQDSMPHCLDVFHGFHEAWQSPAYAQPLNLCPCCQRKLFWSHEYMQRCGCGVYRRIAGPYTDPAEVVS